MQGDSAWCWTKGVGLRLGSGISDLFWVMRGRECCVHMCWIGSWVLLRFECRYRLGCSRSKPGSPARNQQISVTTQDPVCATLPCRKSTWSRLLQTYDQHQQNFKHYHRTHLQTSHVILLFELFLQTLLIVLPRIIIVYCNFSWYYCPYKNTECT
jgi:hypothetical protein